jgi:hypothetical protein
VKEFHQATQVYRNNMEENNRQERSSWKKPHEMLIKINWEKKMGVVVNG